MATLVTLETRNDLLTSDASRAVDARRLETALRQVVRGEVRFDAGSRGAYARDASNYRQIPIGVIAPRDEQDVVEAVRICREHDAPVLARGGGTSLAGQCCNVAVVFDFSKYMHHVIDVDPERRLARVQPGCVLDELRAAARAHGLTFGPDPATHNRCTIGGMIGNNSCGVHSVHSALFGPGARTADNVEALVVLTYDGELLRVGRTPDEELTTLAAHDGRRGEIYRALRDLRDRYAAEIRARFPDIPRRVSGYELPALLPERGFDIAQALVGSESTCALTLEATVRLIPEPGRRTLVVLGYPTVYDAADHIDEIMAHRPIGLEGIDDTLIEFMHKKHMELHGISALPEGGGWLLVEFGGETVEEAEGHARGLIDALRQAPDPPTIEHLRDPTAAASIWELRESGLGATAFVPGEPSAWPGWEDAAVAPERVGDYLREFRSLLDKHGYKAALYGHFGQGCVHCRISFDLETTPGIRNYLAFLDEAAVLVVKYGGSISGEHGDGQARASLLPIMYGQRIMQAFVEFKRIWDPRNRMNPGKLVDPDGDEPYAPQDNLAFGPEYAPPRPDTHFRFPDDGGDFAGATTRCVGVGACRRTHGGTMCPSYMVTREEIHSTRGRARLLFEML
ncbi:MAG: FAD-linked oxidase C-terminal domain-containing protein, partial [Longimicrobiales bacterium]